MSTPTHKNLPRPYRLFLGLLGLLTVLNSALFIHLSNRLDTVISNTAVSAATSRTTSASVPPIAPNGYLLQGKQNAALSPKSQPSPDELIRRVSERTTANPATLAANMDRAMLLEPSIPTIESKQSQWLESSFQAMPNDAPKSFDAQSSCRGRRCLVSGSFSSQVDAQDWADRYLLVAGGKLLQNSRTLLVPAENNRTKLLLYLY